MVSQKEKAIAEHVITLTLESDRMDWFVDDSVDFAPYGAENWELHSVDEINSEEHGFGWRVTAKQYGTQPEKVRSSTHWQPAEYKNHDVTIHGEFTLYPGAEEGFGYARGQVEQEGGIPSPDPEPERF